MCPPAAIPLWVGHCPHRLGKPTHAGAFEEGLSNAQHQQGRDLLGRLLADLENLAHVEGLDALSKRLGGAFGETPAARALVGMTKSVTTARRTGRLLATPALGLGVSAFPASTAVRGNTFFGSDG